VAWLSAVCIIVVLLAHSTYVDAGVLFLTLAAKSIASTVAPKLRKACWENFENVHFQAAVHVSDNLHFGPLVSLLA